MSSPQQPGPADPSETVRRAPNAGSPSSALSGQGFGTQSQWRRPDPRFGPPSGYRPAPPPAGFPQQGQAPFGPPRPTGPFTPQQQYPYQPGFPSAPPQYPAHYPQHWPGQYPPPWPQQPQQPQRPRSVLPVVVLVVVALVAVLGGVALSQRGPGGSTGGYKNEDYQVPQVAGRAPAMPVPPLSQVDDWLVNNRLYDVQMASPVRCDAKPFDATRATEAELGAQLDTMLTCLLRVWGPSLEQAGYTVTRPRVYVMDSPQQTACGKMQMGNAMFCGNDQNLYFATDLPAIFPPSLRSQPWVVESVMAHEYAHAMQGRAGILSARNLLAEEQTSKDATYLLVRRTEAQADCLSGMFWNSTKQSLGLGQSQLDVITETFRSIGSDRDGKNRLSTHPKMATRKAWLQTGLGTTSIGSCNTYAVPADQVA